jgi:hypothetical protein
VAELEVQVEIVKEMVFLLALLLEEQEAQALPQLLQAQTYLLLEAVAVARVVQVPKVQAAQVLEAMEEIAVMQQEMVQPTEAEGEVEIMKDPHPQAVLVVQVSLS